MNEFEIERTSSVGRNTVARATILKESRIGTIEFPQRFLTGTDLTHGRKVINANEDLTISFMSPIYGIIRSYDKPALDSIARSNTVYHKELEAIKKNAKKKDGVLKALLANVSSDVPISNVHDERLMWLQEPLDVVNIFDSRHIGVDELKERINKDLKAIEKFDDEKLVVVRISLRQRIAILKKKLNLIYGTEGIKGIFVPWANPDYAYSKLTLIRDFVRVPKWVNMFGIPKMSVDGGRASLIHILPLYGIDSLSLASHKPFEPDYRIDVKRMDWGIAGYYDFPNEHRLKYGEDLNCSIQCPPDVNMAVKDILDKYSPEERLSVVRVHEAYESQFGMFNIRNSILGSRKALFDLYKTKESANQFIHRTDGIDFGSNALINTRL